jgi:benzoyl-CoA reductase/2-hydroxyglutaryl-CoA dehydratase subunit BcrC/BadD/HgdB
MAETELNGLALAEKYYSRYGVRASELKESGSRVIGYLSALAPVEILTAAGVVPIRLKGNVSEAITKADTHMETIVCPFVRNVFDAALKGRFSFLDGMVLPHLCDSMERTADVWSYNLNLPYWHFLNMPHLADAPSLEFTREIFRIFADTLGNFVGRKITDDDLSRAIGAHNENRRAMRDLYALRKADAPLISGSEMMKVIVAAMSLPVAESTALVESVTREVKERKAGSGAPSARILLAGDQVDDVAIAEAIEATGALLVMDDLSMGSKMYWEDVDVTRDPMEGLVERYLRKLKLPTTYVDAADNYQESLDARFGHLKRHVKEFRADGVILFVYKYCDPYGFEVPAVKSYIESAGTPVLYLEDEYSVSSLGRLKTRIEAFLEMIAQ